MTVVTAGHFLNPPLEGAAFESHVSLDTSPFLVELSDFGRLSSTAGCAADQMQESLGLLFVQKMSDHVQIKHTAQGQGIQGIWDEADLLYAARVTNTGN